MKRNAIVLIVALILLSPMVLISGNTEAQAADMVEIFYLPHPPAQAVVKDVEGILENYKHLDVNKYSFDNHKNKKLIAKYGLKVHMPVAIFINGKNTFTVGKKQVVLTNFPKDNAFVPTLEGKWSYQDLKDILETLKRGR